ncbi:MAG: hypothetical protein IPP69_06865 [Flavobacteriales bacterium]|nr:hypothetical protein [Flavobacteriales bacterium]
MKSKLIIFSATLATLSCLYFVKLNDELVEYSSGKPATNMAVDDKPELITTTVSNLESVKDQWKPTVSTHVLNPRTANRVKGKRGTEIVFPPDAFVDHEGFAVSGAITLTLEECYSIPEILRAKLSTTSDEKMLETAGMIKLTAKSKGKELKIASDKTYTIGFPRNGNLQDDFVLFYGKRNEDDIMNWVLADNEISGVPEDASVESTSSSPDIAASSPNDCFIRITESYLRRDFRVSEMDYFNWRLQSGEGLNQWFVSGFNPDLQMVNDFCNEKLECQITFKVNENGEFDSYYISQSASEIYDNAIVSFLKAMPPLDLSVLMPDYTYEHACILTFGSHIGREQNEIAANFKKRFMKDPEAKMSGVNAADLDFYVLTSSELGWINCDRFYEDENPKVDFYVDNNSSYDCAVSMVFDDINSVVKGVRMGNRTVFSGVPGNQKVRIVSIEDRGGTPQISTITANTRDKEVKMKEYAKFSIKELDAQFASKDKKNTKSV